MLEKTFPQRKEVIMSSAPFNNLQEIAQRKAELRHKIAKQEKLLSADFDAYQEDVDTFKQLWSRLKSIRELRKRANIDGIASHWSSVAGKSKVVTLVSLGAKVARWIWKRKNR